MRKGGLSRHLSGHMRTEMHGARWSFVGWNAILVHRADLLCPVPPVPCTAAAYEALNAQRMRLTSLGMM